MITPLRFIAVLPLMAVLAAPLPAEEVAPSLMMKQALAAAGDRDWSKARNLASAEGPVAGDIITWERLRSGDGAWGEYIAFLVTHGDWPGLARLRATGEARIPPSADPRDVLTFFGDDAPRTGAGALALANAFETLGRRDEAQAVAVRAWRELPMSGPAFDGFLRDWPRTLAAHHEARLDAMLWRARIGDAQEMFPLVSAAWRRLAEARIALRRNRPGVDALIAAVPATLADDPGLAYDRFLWRLDRGRRESALQILLERSRSAEALGTPEAWGAQRRALARSIYRSGDARVAYRVAARHFMSEGNARVDMEWFAGWLALRELGDPMRAARHFETFLTMVSTPISVARGAYWLGRAREAAGDDAAARDAYMIAARHQTTFYGQLATQRAGLPVDAALAGTRDGPDWSGARFLRDPRLAAADLAMKGGDWVMAQLFLRRIAIDLADANNLAPLAQYAIDRYGRADIAVRLAKGAAREGRVYPEVAYPLTDLAETRTSLPIELVKAIARQESELNPNARSSAGALGLMQVMPTTGRAAARQLGIAFSIERLGSDADYNARLGAVYLEGLMARFGGSYVLAAAGYNAGPSRSDSWMERFGDPRRMSPDEAVDWIEKITFGETRNYVQRVIEGLHVYRMRLGGGPVPIRIEEDITAG